MTDFQETITLVLAHVEELREVLRSGQGRTGLLRKDDGDCIVHTGIALGTRPQEEVLQIFADLQDLELFIQTYGSRSG